MTVGIYTLEIHLPAARSLKDKRQVLRRLKDRLRSRFNVSVAELDEHADLWQRAGLMVAAVASERNALERLFESVRRETESHVPGHVSDAGIEYLDGSDGGPSGWESEP